LLSSRCVQPCSQERSMKSAKNSKRKSSRRPQAVQIRTALLHCDMAIDIAVWIFGLGLTVR
jgi:hypothetical protein